MIIVWTICIYANTLTHTHKQRNNKNNAECAFFLFRFECRMLFQADITHDTREDNYLLLHFKKLAIFFLFFSKSICFALNSWIQFYEQHLIHFKYKYIILMWCFLIAHVLCGCFCYLYLLFFGVIAKSWRWFPW